MCGLVGVASVNFNQTYKKAFSHLLYIDAVRGFDSTGVLRVDAKTDKAIKILKYAEPAYTFIERKKYQDLMFSNNPYVFMGHNRAATKGAIDATNAHPFNHGHITLAHNGTLHTWKSLPTKKNNIEFAVDSEAIAHAIAVVGNPVEVLEQLDGAYALTWYDQRQHTLNFARNDDRPLYYALNDMRTTMLWA